MIQRLFLLFCELAEEDVLGVAAGTRNGTSLKGICQIRITQGFQITAAAAGLAELQVVLPGRRLSSAYFFLNSMAPMAVSV